MSHDKSEQIIFNSERYEIFKFMFAVRLLTSFLYLVSVSCSQVVTFVEEATNIDILNLIAFEVQKTRKQRRKTHRKVFSFQLNVSVVL